MNFGPIRAYVVIGEVFERQAGLVNLGDKVLSTGVPACPRSLQGQVGLRVSVLTHEPTLTIRRRRFETPSGLMKPGMFGAALVINPATKPCALLIHRGSALIEQVVRRGKSWPWATGNLSQLPSMSGRIGELQVEILSGLTKANVSYLTQFSSFDSSESSKTIKISNECQHSIPGIVRTRTAQSMGRVTMNWKAVYSLVRRASFFSYCLLLSR